MSGRSIQLTLLACFAVAVFVLTACGDDTENPPATAAPGEQPVQMPTANTAPVLSQPGAPASPAGSTASPALDPEQECRQMAFCERKCKAECIHEERDRISYFDAKKARVGASPFDVKVSRIYLSGSCAKGDDPKKRKSASGVKAIVDGEMTYKGSDMLYSADLEGEMYLKFGKDRYAEVFAADRTYTGGWYRRVKLASRFDRPVRGADPWVSGETREFHWESKPISEAFCEVMPDESAVYIEMSTRGIKSGADTFPTKFVDINWEEVVGMAMRQQVNVITKKGKETLLEPADAIYSQLDRILVTRLTGKTQWLKRYSTTQEAIIPKAPSAAFPVSATSDEWKVSVTGISQVKEFGGYAHKGEDQFLAAVDITLEYTGEESGSPGKMGFKLETSPGKWSKPASKALGQLDVSADVTSGSTVSGKVVFPRQRFQRPFRLEVKTPDKATLYLDVFSYDIGPERAPK